MFILLNTEKKFKSSFKKDIFAEVLRTGKPKLLKPSVKKYSASCPLQSGFAHVQFNFSGLGQCY